MPEPAPLEIGREALVDVSAAIAARDEAGLARALRVAARVADPLAVDEVLLQAHLFVGFPIALEALLLWRTIAPREPPAGLADPADAWLRRGEEVCRRVYGASYERLRANLAALHPDLDLWMVTGGYGRVLGRPALDLATRELCVAALLAVWDAPRQLHSHLRGALNAGASPAEVEAALEVACRHLPRDRVGAIRVLWNRIGARNPVVSPGGTT
jgi:4-carboxymuconolactone decarboxylase